MAYGVLTLLPIVVVVVLALITKRTLEPLIVGSLIAYIITSGWGFPTAWMDSFFETAGNRDHQWVFMVCALLPFSTWAIFFAGLFYAEKGVAELGYGNAIDTFIHIIPFIFYALLLLFLCLFFFVAVFLKLEI